METNRDERPETRRRRSDLGSLGAQADRAADEPRSARRPPQVEIINGLGLHMRPADKFVKLALQFQSEIRVIHNGNEFNGKSILDLTSAGRRMRHPARPGGARARRRGGRRGAGRAGLGAVSTRTTKANRAGARPMTARDARPSEVARPAGLLRPARALGPTLRPHARTTSGASTAGPRRRSHDDANPARDRRQPWDRDRPGAGPRPARPARCRTARSPPRRSPPSSSGSIAAWTRRAARRRPPRPRPASGSARSTPTSSAPTPG